MATFGWAIAVGGTSTLDRINTLFAGSTGEVYNQNRGHFLEHTIDNLLVSLFIRAGRKGYEKV